jgi:hypothetical protein
MRNIFIVLLTCSIFSLQAQDSLVSKKFSFGGYTKEFAIGGTQINDNRAMLFNITSNCVTGTCQHGLGMALISDNGQLIRSAAFGHTINDFDVVEAYKSSDGHCMALGNSTNDVVILQKIDTNLNLVWNKSIPLDPAVDQSDIYIYAAAEIDSRNQVLYANQWFTFDQAGNTVRSKKYVNGFNANSKFDLSAMKKVTANRYAIGGHICDASGFDSDPFMMITDSLGTIIKSKKYKVPSSPYTDQISAIFVKSSNEILALGHKYNDFFMMSLDSNLNITWAKTYSGTGLAAYTHQAVQVNSNCIVVATSGLAFALDASGSVLWSKNINYGSNAKIYATDTCHFATYSTKTINNWGSGFWNKMDAQGNMALAMSAPFALTASSATFTTSTPLITDMGAATTTLTSIPFTVVNTVQAVDSAKVQIASASNCNAEPSVLGTLQGMDQNISVYPNPAHNVLHFNFTYNTIGKYEIRILDISGKMLTIHTNLHGNNSIDISGLRGGLYFYEVLMNGVVTTGKFLKY